MKLRIEIEKPTWTWARKVLFELFVMLAVLVLCIAGYLIFFAPTQQLVTTPETQAFGEEVMNYTNPKMLEGVTKIRIGRPGVMRTLRRMADQEHNAGQYAVLFREIYVEEQEYNRTMYATFTHEIGHHIWQIHFNASQREQYREIAKDTTGVPTDYALEAKPEDFAESFMYSTIALYGSQEWRRTKGKERFTFILKQMNSTFNCNIQEMQKEKTISPCVFPGYYGSKY